MGYKTNNSDGSDYTESTDSKHYKDNLAFDSTDEKINIDEPTKEKKKPKDEWAIDWDDEIETTDWNELSTKEKLKTITINTCKVIFAIACLYIFICSISMLGDAFQILAGKTAGEIFSNDSFLDNPITGLIIGILVTVLVQSSSTSTSIIITMVSANILSVAQAIPIIMGTNIGTSVTNTIVALSQAVDKAQFKKAFAGATIHDIFNLLSVLVFLPLEIITGYLNLLTELIVNSFNIQQGSDAPDFIKVITDPLVGHIVQVNKSVIELAANTSSGLEEDASMINVYCGEIETETTVLLNGTETNIIVTSLKKCQSPEDFLFANTGMSDPAVGAILLVVSLIVLSSCLIGLVKTLGSILKGTVAKLIKKVINLNFDYPFGWVSGYLAMVAGAGLTFIVQSSSVFTSTITPLVGLGIIGLKRMYPLTLGSNIGTTTTSILAALASDPDTLVNALQVSLVHLFFNISGIVLWYPVPFMRIPIKGAKALGNIAAEYRWFAVMYLLMVFFIIPAILLGFSFISEWFAVGVVVFGVVVALFIALITNIQSKRPQWLPLKYRNWKFLPLWCRSLKPYDKFFSKYLLCCKSCKPKEEQDDDDIEIRSVQGAENQGFDSSESSSSGSIQLSTKM